MFKLAIPALFVAAFYIDPTPRFAATDPYRMTLVAATAPQDTFRLLRVLASNPLDDSVSPAFVRAPKYRGAFAVRCDAGYRPSCALALDSADLQPGDWLRVRVMAYFEAEDMLLDRNRQARLILEIPCSDQDFAASARISPQLGNRQRYPSYPGTPGVWNEASLLVRMPKNALPGAELRAYVDNPGGQKLYVDELAVELWGYRRL
jgi:hypothetical protein